MCSTVHASGAFCEHECDHATSSRVHASYLLAAGVDNQFIRLPIYHEGKTQGIFSFSNGVIRSYKGTGWMRRPRCPRLLTYTESSKIWTPRRPKNPIQSADSVSLVPKARPLAHTRAKVTHAGRCSVSCGAGHEGRLGHCAGGTAAHAAPPPRVGQGSQEIRCP